MCHQVRSTPSMRYLPTRRSSRSICANDCRIAPAAPSRSSAIRCGMSATPPRVERPRRSWARTTMNCCGERQKIEGGHRMRIVSVLRSFFLVFAAILTFCDCHALAQTASDNPAMYRGPDREQRLIEGAKKEGQVTVYSSMIADQALRPILNGFEAKYPFVKPQYVRDDPPQQLQKVMAESRASRMVADVLESTGLEVPVRAANIDQPFWSPQIEAYGKNTATRRTSGRRRGTAISAPATTPIWSSRERSRASLISSTRSGRARSPGRAP